MTDDLWWLIEAYANSRVDCALNPHAISANAYCGLARSNLLDALAQPAAAAPVAWMGVGVLSGDPIFAMPDDPRSERCEPWVPLYAAAPEAKRGAQ